MSEKATEEKTIKSVGTVFDIVEFIAGRDDAGVSEIARHLDYSKSTIHYYLKTLERNRYLVNRGGRYRLGLRLVNLGMSALRQQELQEISGDHVERLASETDASAHIMVAQGGRLIVLAKSTPDGADQIDTRVGMEIPIHCTAFGKAILAHQSRDEVNDVLREYGLNTHTEYTITDPEAFRRELDEIRELGFAFDREEYWLELNSIAAPILDESGEERGAVGIIGPTDHVRDPRKHIKSRRFAGEQHELVERTALIITNKLGDR